MKKKIAKILFFFTLLLAMLAGLDALFDRFIVLDKSKKSNWMFSIKNRTFDFAVVGSSRGYRSIEVKLIENKLRQPEGINLGLDGASYAESCLILNRFLRHNRIENILIQIDLDGLDTSSFDAPLRASNYIPYMDDPEVFSYLREFFGFKVYLWKYIPFIKYVEFNDNIGLPSVLSALMPNRKAPFDENGCSFRTHPFRALPVEKAVLDINPGRVEDLEQLIDIARTSKSHVILFMAPYHYTYLNSWTNRTQVLDFYSTLARTHSIDFLVPPDDSIARDQSLFADSTHLNKTGAIRFTELLTQSLKNRLK